MNEEIKLTTIRDTIIPMSITEDNTLRLKQDNALKGDKGDKGDPFIYADFTKEQLEALRGPRGFQGEKGDSFIYEDFTTEQLELLRGPQGIQGDKGDPFIYEDFTTEQLEGLRGPKGEPGKDGAGVTILGKYNTSEELTTAHPTGKLGDAYLVNENLYIWNGTIWKDVGPIRGPQGLQGERGLQGIQGIQGEKGNPFLYEDFTPTQLEGLRGPQGIQGVPGPTGNPGPQGEPFTYEDLTQVQIDELAKLVADKAQDIDLTPYAKKIDMEEVFKGYYDKGEVDTLLNEKANLAQIIRYDITQSLTVDQQIQARNNIGAGTSSFDGNYNSLSSKPTIPTKTSQLTNDSGYLTSHQDISSLITHTQNSAVHVTANDKVIWSGKADKSTTLAGYGIKDGYTKTEIDNLFANVTIDTSALVDKTSAQTISGVKTFSAALQVNNNITATGDITGARVYNAVWNDYAEWFEKEDQNEQFEVGEIVCWAKNGVTICSEEKSRLVVGVVTNSYGHILGGELLDEMDQNKSKYVPVGLKGRVPVKIIGSIERGDLIVSSGMKGVGVASKGVFPTNMILGKSLESSDDENIKLIKMLIL